MEQVAIPFSRGSSLPRDGTWVSCIAGRFFTDWPTREAPEWEALPLTHYVTSNSPELLWIHSLSCEWADWNKGSQGPSLVASLVGFPSSSDSKASAFNKGDPGSVPGSGRSTGEGNGNSPQYSCLQNFMTEELAGYSPWGCKESDTTKRLTYTRPFQVQYLDSMLGELKHVFYSRNICGKNVLTFWWIYKSSFILPCFLIPCRVITEFSISEF